VIDLRLSGTVKTCTILSFVVILLSAFYFNFFMPFWNFMVEAELDDMSNKDIDPIVSFDLQRPTKSPDNSTPEPGTTPGPSEEPVEVPVVEEGTLNVLILGADDAASLVDTIIVVNGFNLILTVFISSYSKIISFPTIANACFIVKPN
jgi:hypothetical protein